MPKIPPPPEYSISDPAQPSPALDAFTGKQGYVFASPEEALAGEAAEKLMSPLTTKQVVDEAVPDWATLEDAEIGSVTDKIMSPATTRHAIEIIAGTGAGGGTVSVENMEEVWNVLLTIGGDNPDTVESLLDQLNGEIVTGIKLGNVYLMADSLNGEFV